MGKIIKRRAYREKREDTEGVNMAKGKNVNTSKKMVNKDHMDVFGGIKGKDCRSICTGCTADTYDERICTEDS